MRKDILNFKVKFYSTNSISSPVINFIANLEKKNKTLALKSLQSIKRLTYKICYRIDTKPIKIEKNKFWELKVKHGSNNCRFFFLIDSPNIIVIFGFIKKTQKINKKDLKQGVKYYKDYIKNKISIDVNMVLR